MLKQACLLQAGSALQIVDFYCKELQLAIEVDGESHYGNEERDKRKDKRLNQLGVTVLGLMIRILFIN